MRPVSRLVWIASVLIGMAPAAAMAGGGRSYRPQTTLGQTLYRESKQLRRPLAGPATADKLLRAGEQALPSGSSTGARAELGFQVKRLVEDAVALSGGSLSAPQKKQATRLLRRANEVLLKTAWSEGYPGDALYSAKAVLEGPAFGTTPRQRQYAARIASTALNKELEHFLASTAKRDRSSIAAFADDRKKDGQEIRKMAEIPISSPWASINKSIMASTAETRRKAADYVSSPEFARFVNEGAARDRSPFAQAGPPKTVEALQQILSIPIRSIYDVRALEQLLAKSTLKPNELPREALSPLIDKVASQVAREARNEVRFRAHYIEGPQDAARFMKNYFLKDLSSISRLSNRLAAYGASSEARRQLDQGRDWLQGLTVMSDPGQAGDKLYQRVIHKTQNEVR